MVFHSYNYTIKILLSLLILVSCIEKDVYEGDDHPLEGNYDSYLYQYDNEAHNIVAEIELLLVEAPEVDQIITEIPVLKYNKSWLFMLTQDDCTHSAYSTTWAAINGKPLSNNYFYSAEQLAAGDLPPDYFTLNKTLGSTDGAGNEIRFTFTTTLAPEMEWMENEPHVNIGFSRNYYRFYMMSGLTWNNVAEMLAYDTGIAFHDLKTNSKNNKDSLLKHLDIAQKITMEKLSGRGLKVLAEPNGNHNYLLAGKEYPSIRIMTAQNSKPGGPVVEPLFPYRAESDLEKAVLQRTFYNNTFDINARIENELKKNKEEREAIHVGIHGSNVTFTQFLLWLNNSYGKDGDDSVWVPSFEEYYEYNYYRVHSTIDKEINGDTLKLRITLPAEQYFYYPSLTVNLSGITYDQISRVISNDAVTGLSYAEYEGGVMLNIDCRRFLFEHAAHFVEKYLKSSTTWNRDDAIYFVDKLKESPKKDELRKKIPGYTNK
jgi:hypothetical protein